MQIIFLVITSLNGFSQQITIGAGNLRQSWTTVDSSPDGYKKFLKGRLISISLNSGGVFDDGDWNIYIKPNFGYEYLARNSKGTINKDGIIEIEIHNAFPIDDYFRPNDIVTAYGWWVEDSGHDSYGNSAGITHDISSAIGGKTEIHPISYLTTEINNGAGKKILMLHDGSNESGPSSSPRFHSSIVNPAIIRTSCDLKYLPETSQKNLNKIEASKNVVPLQVKEKASIDFTYGFGPDITKEYMVNYWNHNRSNVKYEISPSRIDITSTMKLSSRFINNNNVVGIRPFAYFEFNSTDGEPLNERYRYTVHENYVSIDVSIRLNNPGINIMGLNANKYPEVKWNYLTNSNNLEFRTSSKDVINLKFLYSPKQGHTNTEWFVELFASDTKGLKWNPGLRTMDQAQGMTWNYRSMIFLQRTYTLKPSEIVLDIVNPTDPTKLDIMSSYQGCFPEIKLAGPIKYSISIMRKGNGEPASELEGRFIDVTSQIQNDDFVCTLNPANSSINFTFQNKLVGSEGLILFQNASKILLRANAETTLGEKLVNDVVIMAPLWRSKPELIVRMADFIKVIKVADYLGVNIPRWNAADANYSPIPQNFSNDFITKWRNDESEIGEVDINKHQPEIQKLTEIYARVFDNLPVSSNDYQILINSLERVSRLPSIPRKNHKYSEKLKFPE